ncbi:uncharacterized protein UTRI_06738_B [Ustilago trichophora]|uniref:NADAR domain-containing protein n=1 Tax=Ustilago trichophora TaxID=86804 RepID=A0A5C3EN09_9BASI|nr:uncharacterized protein UTRI_06738_B [Ustilago trichophora]
MSSAVVSAPFTSTTPSESRRRSLFKPSTWTSKKHKAEIHQGAQPAGLAPGITAAGGAGDVDAVEGGAPLSSIVQSEAQQQQQQQQQEQLGERTGEEEGKRLSSHVDGRETNQSLIGASGSNSGSGLTTVLDPLGRVVFFRQDLPNYHLSNSSLSYPVVYNSIRYPSAEHLFQALKFLPDHPEIASKIRRTKHPLDAIRLARSNTALMRPGWISEGINVRIMHHVVLAKFSQYSNLAEALLETEDREIINDTPSDVFWGIGGGRGRNVLGKTLMDVREVLRTISGLGWGSGAKTM